jgi:hypothetical protein
MPHSKAVHTVSWFCILVTPHWNTSVSESRKVALFCSNSGWQVLSARMITAFWAINSILICGTLDSSWISNSHNSDYEIAVFWNIISCSLVDHYQCFTWTYHLQLQCNTPWGAALYDLTYPENGVRTFLRIAGNNLLEHTMSYLGREWYSLKSSTSPL